MGKLPFKKELKEALNKPTLTQRETALAGLVMKLQDALEDSNCDKLNDEQGCDEANINARVLAEETVEELPEEVDTLSERVEELEEIVESLED